MKSVPMINFLPLLSPKSLKAQHSQMETRNPVLPQPNNTAQNTTQETLIKYEPDSFRPFGFALPKILRSNRPETGANTHLASCSSKDVLAVKGSSLSKREIKEVEEEVKRRILFDTGGGGSDIKVVRKQIEPFLEILETFDRDHPPANVQKSVEGIWKIIFADDKNLDKIPIKLDRNKMFEGITEDGRITQIYEGSKMGMSVRCTLKGTFRKDPASAIPALLGGPAVDYFDTHLQDNFVEIMKMSDKSIHELVEAKEAPGVKMSGALPKEPQKTWFAYVGKELRVSYGMQKDAKGNPIPGAKEKKDLPLYIHILQKKNNS